MEFCGLYFMSVSFEVLYVLLKVDYIFNFFYFQEKLTKIMMTHSAVTFYREQGVEVEALTLRNNE